jgi:zinc/manganese transport system substrate-binding protein
MLTPALASLVLAVGACAADASAPEGASGPLQVVAAENFWGNIAVQIAGTHARVASLIVNPDTDPHGYEPTPNDARTIAGAGYVIENGAGYDPWVDKLLDANPVAARMVLDVARLNGVAEGGNPHMWYSPTFVLRVASRIASDLGRLDPSDADDFQSRLRDFEDSALKRYDDLRGSIRNRYAGVPVGASESIFVYLARDLELDLITPPDFMKAISEGTDPTAQDKQTFDEQVVQHRIKVLVYNRQNSVPDVDVLRKEAQAEGIPVVAITETLDPASATFQDWQVAQLDSLRQALGQATGR